MNTFLRLYLPVDKYFGKNKKGNNIFYFLSMKKNVVCVHYENCVFYVECYENETIDDLKNTFVKRYDFDDNKQLELYQHANKLNPNIKMKELRTKNNLYLKGTKKPKRTSKKEKEEIEESFSNINYISKFHEMGFKESDELIENLLQKEGNKIEDVVVVLLKKKKKKMKKKLLQNSSI